MNEITTVGVDLAKEVIAVCAAERSGKIVFTRVFRREGVRCLGDTTAAECVRAGSLRRGAPLGALADEPRPRAASDGGGVRQSRFARVGRRRMIATMPKRY